MLLHNGDGGNQKRDNFDQYADNGDIYEAFELWKLMTCVTSKLADKIGFSAHQQINK